MSEEMKPCPQCASPYGYESGDHEYTCPECGHTWNPGETPAEALSLDPVLIVLDANGNPLQNGDTVIVVKNLPVRGATGSIKAGTKVKNIRLTEGDHNIDCKVDGFGAMSLKSEFVRKA